MASPLPCPNCKAPASVANTVRSKWQCFVCSRMWSSLSDYEVTTVTLGVPGDDETEYLDGELKDDLTELVRASQMSVLELVRSQLPIIDWDKTGSIATGSMDLYLKRMIADLRDGTM